MESFQNKRQLSKNRVKTIVMSPGAATNVLSNGTQFSYILQRNSLRVMHNPLFRFKITASSSWIKVAPTPYWWQRIENYSRSNNQVELCRTYNDNLMIDLSSVVDDTQLQYWQDLCNFNSTYYDGKRQEAGTSRYYYLPLIASMYDLAEIDESSFSNADIEWRFYPQNGILVAGSGTYTLDEVALICEEEIPDSVSQLSLNNLMTNYVKATNYLVPVINTVTNTTMNQSTTYYYGLDVFNHRSSFMVVCIRPTSPSNTGNGFMNFADLSGGSMDVVSPANQSLLGGGTPVAADYLRLVEAGRQFNSNFFKDNCVYPIVWCNDVLSAYAGRSEGYFLFDSTKNQLAITTPGAPTNEVQTCTFSIAVTAGTFKVAWKGVQSTVLQYNDTPTTIQTAIQAIQTVIDAGINVVVNQTPSANTSLTFTITGKSGQPIALYSNFEVSSALTGASSAAVSASVALTTGSVPGWLNGNYDLQIYSYHLSQIRQSNAGISILPLV